MERLYIVLILLGSYLLGSLSSAVITCRLMGLPDPRGVGSGNPGATNVYQTAGRRAALFTLSGDLLKGLSPVLFAKLFAFEPSVLALVALFSFMGHLYPIFFGFRGGKGVATAFGAILGLDLWVALAMLLSWLLVYLRFRLSSLSALVTALLTPLYFYLLNGEVCYLILSVVLALFVFYRHRSNIKKIIEGTED